MSNDQVLSKNEISQVKKELLERKAQILDDLKDIVDIVDTGEDGTTSKVKFPEYGDKSDENAQEIAEYTTNLATDKALEGTLRDIDTTLERIEAGTYGVCKYCEKDIPKKRMIARPVASACVECKTKLQSRI